MLGEARDRVAATAAGRPVSGDASEEPGRAERLAELEARLDEKLARLEALDTAAERDGEAAMARRLADRAERHAARLEQQLIERLNAQRDAFLEALAGQVAAERGACQRELTREFTVAREELDRHADGATRRVGAALQHVRELAARAGASMEQHAAEVVTRGDAVRVALDERLEAKRHDHIRQTSETVADAEARLDGLTEALEQRMLALSDGLDERARAVIAELRDRAGALVDQMAGTVASLAAFPPSEGRGSARAAA